MKVLVFSDLHYHLKNMNTAHRCLQTIEDIAIQSGINHIFCLGDFWHEKSMLRSEVLRKVFSFFKSSRMQWHILVGNHDLETTLDTAGNALDILNIIENVEVISEPKMIGNCFFIPFCRSADEFRAIVERIPAESVVLIHQGVEGAAYSSGVAHVSEIKQEDLKKFDLVISGHIHAPQQFGNLVYVGSPMSHTFSEAGEKKGAIILDDSSKRFERVCIDNLPRHIAIDVEIPSVEEFVEITQSKLIEVKAKQEDNIRVRVLGEKGVLKLIDKSMIEMPFENLVLQRVETSDNKKRTIEETLSYDEMVVKYLDESPNSEISKDELIKISREILSECVNAQI